MRANYRSFHATESWSGGSTPYVTMMYALRHIRLIRFLAAALGLSVAVATFSPYLAQRSFASDVLTHENEEDAAVVLNDLLSRATADAILRQAVLSPAPTLGVSGAGSTAAVGHEDAVRSLNLNRPVTDVLATSPILPAIIAVVSSARPLGP